jgi:acetylornithine deacetylase/succinyl-diaminopimelate desuccinylase-like protein
MDDQTLAWCKRLIGCRSVTGEGTRAIAELCVRELLLPNGIEARLIPSPREGAEQVNLVALVKGRDSGCAPLLFNSHLDTVPPGEGRLWTECSGDPFAASVKGERIYGLGAADTKLDFVAKVTALIEEGVPRRDVWLVATFGEEHGLVGAKEIAESGLLPRGALAFVGEPSRLEVITAHKGLMVFALSIGFTRVAEGGTGGRYRQIVFEGRAAHSSTPALGCNAIILALEALAAQPDGRLVAITGGDAVNKVPAACDVIQANGRISEGGSPVDLQELKSTDAVPPEAITALARFVTELQSFADGNGTVEDGYAPPILTCNPGRIESLADRIVLDFELRPPPGLPLDVVRQGVNAIVAGLARNVGSITLELEERRANPGFRSGLDQETVEVAMAALAGTGLPLNSGVKAGCTEAGIYAAAGLEPVVFGPGPSTGVIHAPNEYNLISDVEGAMRFYRELLRS